MKKRLYEEILSPSKHQRLEVSTFNENSNTYANELNVESLGFSNELNTSSNLACTAMSKSSSSDMKPNNDMQVSEPTFVMNHSTNTCDVTSSFSDSSCDFMSAKDYLNTFFNELKFSNISSQADNLDESLQDTSSSIPHVSDELQSITPTTMIDSVNNFPCTKDKRTSKSILFQKELGDFIFLTLKIHNRQYYVHIREIKRNVFTNEEIPTKNRIFMDINSWYEFQYKMFAFNLKYKSSSFIANNTILVLNYNNSIMRIKNLRNYLGIELSDYQLEKLKEVAYDLNNRLIHHMYNKHLPHLIKNKCTLGNISPEKELMLISKLFLSIEQNVLTILNRIYECNACIFEQHSQSLHQCFLFNNREKFQQLGDMMLMLVDLNCVVSLFSNEVDCITDHLLYNINVEAIKNAIFQSEK